MSLCSIMSGDHYTSTRNAWQAYQGEYRNVYDFFYVKIDRLIGVYGNLKGFFKIQSTEF